MIYPGRETQAGSPSLAALFTMGGGGADQPVVSVSEKQPRPARRAALILATRLAAHLLRLPARPLRPPGELPAR
jgi:hypothetical protein